MVDRYDAGQLNDYGGGDVDWWWDYLRAEIDRANDFHADIHEQNDAALAAKDAEIDRLREALRSIAETRWDTGASEACLCTIQMDARAALRETAGEMVVVSTTDVDQNGDHIEMPIPRSEWEASR